MFEKESDLVAAFCEQMMYGGRCRWVFYHETAGFDLVLVQKETGVQIGFEAKLSLNLKVLAQALPSYTWDRSGPDYRGVIVPLGKVQHNLSGIAARLGVGVIQVGETRKSLRLHFRLPDEQSNRSFDEWHPWLPIERCTLPEYVPDVSGGKPSPLALTLWKVRAIKLMILLERRGAVTRKDMKALDISPTAWTRCGGYLSPSEFGYVASANTPDFRAQHPVNWGEIEADFEKWAPPISLKQAILELK